VATRGQKIRVGAFLLASGVLAASAFAVSARLRATKTVDYFVRFDESVSGLSPGSEVRYRGVPVGNVEEMKVSEDNRVVVRARIRPERVTLREGVTASADLAGITGYRVLQLSGGDGAPLPPGSEIAATRGVLANITEELPPLLTSVRKALEDVEPVVGSARRAVEQIEQLAEEVRAAVGETRPPLVRALRSLDDTLARVREILEKVDLAAPLRQAELFARDARALPDDVGRTLAMFRETLARVRDLADLLERDPGVLLRGRTHEGTR